MQLIEYNGTQKETRLTFDRTRTINYDGAEVMANTYKCTSCNEVYIMEQMPHSFCPCCGVKYKYRDDVSV